MGKRRVNFGRINRRDQATLGDLTFGQEMQAMADLEKMELADGARTWIAADLTIDDAQTYLTGLLGFEDEDQRIHFDRENNSWKKGETETAEGASSKALVPFAVDLDDGARWVAFAQAPRIPPPTFRTGFELTLNAAREHLEWPTNWEVDLVTSESTVHEWVLDHPDVKMIRLTIKLPNPGRDLSEDIEQMRALAARTKREEFKALYNRELNVLTPAGDLSEPFKDVIRGSDKGQVEIALEARGPTNRSGHWFSSSTYTDRTWIEDYGQDWDLGVALVLAELRRYSQKRSTDAAEETPPTSSDGVPPA
jgi:hypothetical protein